MRWDRYQVGVSIALTGRTARVPLLVASAGGAFALWRLASFDFVNPNDMLHPHGYRDLGLSDLAAAHVVSDTVIALSYLTISLTLVYLVRTAHRHIPFSWMFVAFGMFIGACGMTHAMEIVTLWQPWFWLSADVKIVTALAAVWTAIALPPLVPKILAMVAAASVSEQRRVALEEANAELERRVDERTEQLSDAIEREHALRERAEEANRLKDEFLSTVSHELRTPLTAILGWGEMLAKHQLAPAAEQRAIASIRRNARAQTRLVDDLLDVSRLTTGTLCVNRRAIAFDEVVEGAIDSIRPVAAAKGISVVINAPRSSSFVLGDAHRLQQIVWNLLTNAVKFTPDGGTVTISMTRGPRQVRLEVADTGLGLDPSFVSHVFERFRQADSSPSRPQTGLGLGLSLARHLTELHGGHIGAHSDGLGRGSTFTIEFPLTRPPAQTDRLPLGDQPAV